MSPSWAEIAREVVARAANRCEYCKMHQSLQGAAFHIEHIVPRAASGSDDPNNLALACPGCNLRKSDRTTARDPETGTTVELFHPRHQKWVDHFSWDGLQVIGQTPAGRATVFVLDMNSPRRLSIREAEGLFGLFPPGD